MTLRPRAARAATGRPGALASSKATLVTNTDHLRRLALLCTAMGAVPVIFFFFFFRCIWRMACSYTRFFDASVACGLEL